MHVMARGALSLTFKSNIHLRSHHDVGKFPSCRFSLLLPGPDPESNGPLD